MSTIIEKGIQTTPSAGTGFSLVAILEIIQGRLDLEAVNLSQDLETWLMRIIAFLLITLSPFLVSWGRTRLGLRTRNRKE